MRVVIGTMILAAGLVLGVDPSAAAAPVGTNLRSVELPESITQQVQYWQGRHCERLRRACVYKEQRGEVGEGNCRRYREECGGGVSYCERLRRACVYKDQRGEVGEGNCRRYRAECGSRRY